jgi:hypothetical protein
MELELGPLTRECTTKVTELDVVYQPYSMLDIDQAINFDLLSGDLNGAFSSFSLISGVTEFLECMRSQIADIGDLHIARLSKHGIDTSLPPMPRTTLQLTPELINGPRFCSPSVKAFKIDKFENDRQYDSIIVLPIPFPCSSFQLEGILYANDPETNKYVVMAQSEHDGFRPVVTPDINTIYLPNNIAIKEVRGLSKAEVNDDVIFDIIPKLDTLCIPLLYVLDGVVYSWDGENSRNFYKS